MMYYKIVGDVYEPLGIAKTIEEAYKICDDVEARGACDYAGIIKCDDDNFEAVKNRADKNMSDYEETVRVFGLLERLL